MSRHITEAGVKPVLKKISKLNHQLLDGKQQAIRKNPLANAVGLDLNIQHNYWSIMSTEI